MNARVLAAMLCLALYGAPAVAEMSMQDVRTRPTPVVEAALPSEHPAAYYIYASRLFGEARRDEAVFWFYAGQLRYRFHLSANPQLPRDGDPAVLASLNATMGQTLNEYAGGDPAQWAAQIERALKWDADTPNGYTSKDRFRKEWQDIRAGLASMRDTIVRDADKIREQRTKAGLPNR